MGAVTDFIQSAIPKKKKRKRMKFAYGLVLGLLAFTQAKKYGEGKLENKDVGDGGYGGGKLENNNDGKLRIWESIDYDDGAEKCSPEDIGPPKNCRTEYCPNIGDYCCSCYPDKKVKA